MENEPVEYKGHLIELRSVQSDEAANFESKRDDISDLLIDNKPVNYGQLPDGAYFLNEYAYDWRGNLIDLAKGFIDYTSSTEKNTSENKTGEGS